MDTGELDLFRRSLEGAVASDDVDLALADVGWHEAHADDPRAAVSTLFEMQGRANAASSALDAVLARAMGVEGPVVLPPLGSTDVPTDRGLAFRGRVPTGLAPRPVDGLDPTLGLVEVTGDIVVEDSCAWAGAVAAGQRALAHELVGASRAMLQLARDHAVERVQFARPIASFQAVRHRLAEALVVVEAADAAAYAAWDDSSQLTAALAKAVAGRSARTVARHSQQVLAGIGFTTEHPFHRYFRRVVVLDALLGDSRTLTKALGAELLRTRQLPPLLPL